MSDGRTNPKKVISNLSAQIADFDSAERDFFSQVLEINDRDTQAALHSVANLDLVLSLFDAPTEVVEKIMSNLAPRAQVLLREDLRLVSENGLWENEKIDTSMMAKREARSRFAGALYEANTKKN